YSVPKKDWGPGAIRPRAPATFRWPELLADRRALGARSRRGSGRSDRSDVDPARRGRVDVGDAGRPTRLRARARGDRAQRVAGRGAERGGAGGRGIRARRGGRVLERIGEVRLF